MRRVDSKFVVWLGVITISFFGHALNGSQPQFTMIRSTIDGGGVMRSAGGAFELSATIGQPDAKLMTGGRFELAGGFWFGLVPSDCNEDGLVNGFDYINFADCMFGPAFGMAADPCPCFDTDNDGSITLEDFAKLQQEFVGQ